MPNVEPQPSPNAAPTGGGRHGRLALADGSVFHGTAFGAVGRGITQTAEVVFNTAMTGYQEALTDPSYAGQILVMTAPLIGNTGVNPEDFESARVQVSGFVVRERAAQYSNFRATSSLDDYLAQSNGGGVLGLSGIDTRALTRRLRVCGVMSGVLTDSESLSDADLVRAARSAPSMTGQNLVPLVGCRTVSSWSETLGEWSPRSKPGTGRRFRVLALDCGAKQNILRNLSDRGCDVDVIPNDTKAAELTNIFQNHDADGLFLSNGPGDPEAVTATISAVRAILNGELKHIPIFGICLGHQILALALGAQTYKLKFGHRGANHPVLNLITGRVEITSQNHGFAVDADSVKSFGGEATHINLNDGTLAGFCLRDRPAFSVQHHPEASPGPHDSSYLFDMFLLLMAEPRPLSLDTFRRARSGCAACDAIGPGAS